MNFRRFFQRQPLGIFAHRVLIILLILSLADLNQYRALGMLVVPGTQPVIDTGLSPRPTRLGRLSSHHDNGQDSLLTLGLESPSAAWRKAIASSLVRSPAPATPPPAQSPGTPGILLAQTSPENGLAAKPADAPCLALVARSKRDKIDLQWSPVPAAVTYEIYRGIDADPVTFARVHEVPAPGTVFVDSPLGNEVTYLYFVRAVGSGLVCDSVVAAAHPSAIRASRNFAPVIYSFPEVGARPGESFLYHLRAADPFPASSIRYALTEGPTGMEVDPVSGSVHWLAEAGTFAIRLQAIDEQGAADAQSFTLEIAETNQPPTANAGRDQSASLGVTVTLDGSESTDLDGDPLTYHWRFIERPERSLATLSDATAVRPVFVTDLPGNYTVELIVNDGSIESVPDFATISTTNSPPVADAGLDQTVPVGQTATLDASRSTDPDHDLLTFAWTLVGQPDDSQAAISNATSKEATFVVDRKGTYVAQLLVHDGYATSAPDLVTINTTNSRPVANAGADQTVLVGDTVQLNGSGSFDVDQDPLTYRWSVLSTPAPGIPELLEDPESIAPHYVAGAPGDYVLQLVVNDQQQDSGPDTITVTAQTRFVAVPDVLGLTRTEAEAKLLAAGLAVGVVSESTSEKVPAGRVMLQNPEAGAHVQPGSQVSFVLSLGLPKVRVPDVVGLARSEAESRLANANLTVGQVTETHHATVPTGHVISQDPVAGSAVPAGTAVILAVSLGPEATCPFTAEEFANWTLHLAPPVPGGILGTITAADCAAVFTEGNSFKVELSRGLVVPSVPSMFRMTYKADFASTSTDAMRDAFELALVDDLGRPWTWTLQGTAAPIRPNGEAPLPLPPSPDACFNHTEGANPFAAQGAALLPALADPGFTTVVVDVSQLLPGTSVQTILRLINNDRDAGTVVRVSEAGFVPFDPGLDVAGSGGPALSVLLGPPLAAVASTTGDSCDGALSFSVRQVSAKTTGGSSGTGIVQTPVLSIMSPQDNARVAIGAVLLSGQAEAHTPEVTPGVPATNGIRLITINGQPCEAVDGAGRFFTIVQVQSGQNVFAVVALDGFDQTTTNRISVYGVQCLNTFSRLGVVSSSIQPLYGRTSFDEGAKILYADLALRNMGGSTVRSPMYLGLAGISERSVQVLSADGISSDGIPYYDFSTTLINGALDPQQSTFGRALAFYNPNNVQFTYSLVVVGQLNQDPAFTSAPIVTAIAGRPYVYESKATDPDGDNLVYSLAEAPSGMSVDAATGRITWTASSGTGSDTVKVVATDGRGGVGEQRYQIEVIGPSPNRPPAFRSSPIVLARVGSPYSYQPQAVDPDGDTLSFALTDLPLNMTVDAASGRVQWVPTADQLGIHNVALTVSDQHGGEDVQSFLICVQPAEGNRDPIILSQPITNFILVPHTPSGSITLDMKVRDFNADHKDFEGVIDFRVITGLVEPILGQDRTPTYARSGESSNSFYRWFHDVPGSNITAVLPLMLNEMPAGSHIFTYTNLEFFPIDNQLFGNEGRDHNFHFTVEAHSTLTYRGGEVVRVSGDDDSWVFVDKRLVVDLGGVYPDGSGAVSLDGLGLIPGDRYAFDLFTTERHTVGSYLRLSLPSLEVHRGEYSTRIEARDPENDDLRYNLITGPPGVAINPASGVMTWSPTTADLGEHTIGIRVMDSRGGTAEQTFSLTVCMPESGRIAGSVFADGNTNGVQDASETGLPGWTAFLDQNQNGRLDSGELSVGTESSGQYAFSNLVAGNYLVRLAPVEGWVPTVPDHSTQNLTLPDGHTKLVAHFGVRQKTGTINSAPRFVSQPPTAIIAPGSVMLYHSLATDGDADALAFDLVVSPEGMPVDGNSGLVAWQPTINQLGTQDVILRVQDGKGGVALQPFQLIVKANSPPVITTVPAAQAIAGLPFQYVVRAQDSDGDLLDFELASVEIKTTQYFDIAIGDAVSEGSPRPGAGYIETPFSEDVYTFTALPGDKIYFAMLGNSPGFSTKLQMVDELGTPLFNSRSTAGADVGVLTLTRGGIYTLTVGSDADEHTGTYGFKLWSVPSPGQFSIAIGDSVTNGVPAAGAGNIESPGAKDIYTFTASAGQQIYFASLGSSPGFANELRMFDETGAALFGSRSTAGSDVGVLTLAGGGTYTITVGTDTADNRTGTYGFKLWNVPPPDQFTIAIGDTITNGAPAAGAGNIESPGVKDIYTLTATPGRQVYFDILGTSGFNPTLRMVDDVGAAVFGSRGLAGPDVGSLVLSRGGSYTITVGSDHDDRIGTYGFQITNVSAAAAIAIAAQDIALDPPRVASATNSSTTSTRGRKDLVSPKDSPVLASDAGSVPTLVPFSSNGQTPGQGGALLTWTPGLADAGTTYSMEIVVRDAYGAETRQRFELKVVTSAPNHPPVIISTPRSSVRIGMTYDYQLGGTDADGDPLQYHLGSCCLEPPQGQVAWWRGEGDALDALGPNTGSLSNGVTFATGRVGQAFSFDGLNNKVAFAESATIDLSRMPEWTIEAWVNPSRFANHATIYSEGRWIASLGLQQGTGRPESLLNGGNSLIGNIAVQSNQWSHVALVFTGATRTLYVNGVFAGASTALAITPDSNGSAMGDVTHSPSATAFEGQIDELGLYSRALTPSEVQAIYNAGAVGKCPALQDSEVVPPAGLTLDPKGMISWTPTAAHIGTHRVQVCAEDGHGGFASQIFSLSVSSTLSNQAPTIVSVPPGRATADQLYQYDLKASDPDNDTVTWRLVSGPLGMSVDPASGAMRWIPMMDQLGVHSITVEVQDALLITATQTWTIEVGCLNGPPQITSTPETDAHVGESYLYALSASDPDGDALSFSFVAATESPSGMTISNLTSASGSGVGGGVLAWTPGADQIGSYAIRVGVSDGRGGVDTQNYTLHVSDLHANRAPFIVSVPANGAAIGQTYTYVVKARDPDGDPLGFQLLAAPRGATLGPQPGIANEAVLAWTPSSGDAGGHEFVVAAVDPSGASGTQRFLVLARPNSPPEIVSAPPTDALVNLTYTYDVAAADPDDDPLAFTLTRAPTGMVIDASGHVSWPVEPADLGAHEVEVTVTDGFGGSASQAFTVVAGADTEPPSVSLEVTYNLQDASGNLYVEAGTTVPAYVVASDNVGISTLALVVDGVVLPLNPNGSTMVSFLRAGSIEAIAQARDLDGNISSVTNRIPVVDLDATDTVHVTIVSPTAGAEVTRPVDVIATITSEAPLSEVRVEVAEWNLSDSTLEVAVSDRRLNYQMITNVVLPPNTTVLTEAVLARFDPTALLNGAYLIRVTAYDQNRQGRQEGVLVNVTGNLKFGEFRVEFPDLAIPVAGIPITIKRIYDSRDAARQGDFGFGWSLGIQDAHLLEVGKSQFSGLGGQDTTFTSETRVYLTTPTGRRVGFSFTPELSGVAFLFGAFYKPAFTADPGIYDILEPLTAPAAYQFNSRGQFTGILGLSSYTPEGYKLTTKDNLTYLYDREAGLKSVTDLNGNNLQYTRAGIFHYSAGATSADQAVQFIRDSAGRIIQVIDPDGHPLTYTYDGHGDLRSFADQVTNVTQYIYHDQRAHYLTNIIDSLGRQALRLEYDAGGRLVSVTDALDHPIRQEFDSEALTGTVTDANANVTASQYDERGNETMRVLQGIYTNRMEYDANNNLTRFVNGRGYATNFTYDARGNRTSITDALSNRTTIAYNAQNKPVAVTNALGQITTVRYDANGNVVGVINNAGFGAGLTRDSQGRVTSIRDAKGNTTTFDYAGGCSCGKPRKVINPDGSLRLYEYNSLGQTNRVANELGAETLFEYDDNGKLLSTQDPLGNMTRYFYQKFLLTNVVDALNRSTRYEYDALNRTNKIINAEGGIVEFLYDGNGNRTHLIDPVGNDTTFVYDVANRPIQQIDPLGHSSFFAYDAAGNRIEAVDRNGRRRTFAYDGMNRMTNELWWEGVSVTRSIVFGYNELGIQTLAADPSAHLDYIYDNLNRLERVVQSKVPGQLDFTLNYTYTALGQVESVTDNWGVSVGSTYDHRNRLAKRTWMGPGIDPVREDFSYDAAGFRTRIDRYADLDGANRVGLTTNAYNLAGLVRNIAHLGPAAEMMVRYDYTRDAVQQITQWSINSQLSTFKYDLTGQLTNALYSALPNESFRYDANGNRLGVQPSGNYTVGINNQILSDGTNHHSYDAEGNMTSSSNNLTGAFRKYKFDHRNRLTTVLDHDSSGVVTQTVSFIYDALDRRIARTVNDHTTRFLYENNNAWTDLDGFNNVAARYLMGSTIDALLARQRPGEGQAWYLTDHLGTVRDIADSAGTLVAHVAYDAFGHVIGVSGNGVFGRFQFTGRDFDEETGLHYYRARYYNQNLGRFMIQDPIGFDGGDVNLYRYVGNSPINSTDSTGQAEAVEYNVTVQTSEGPYHVFFRRGNKLAKPFCEAAKAIADAAAVIPPAPLGSVPPGQAIEFVCEYLAGLP